MEGFNRIIVEAKQVLEEARKVICFTHSKTYRRKMRKIYSNRREMKKIIRQHEERLAKILNNLNSSQDISTEVSELEWELEFFLTWRLKLMKFPETMWCDGVEQLKIDKTHKRSFYIEAKIVIGPERDINTLYYCDLFGTITLNQALNCLKNYRLKINDDGKIYMAQKGLKKVSMD